MKRATRCATVRITTSNYSTDRPDKCCPAVTAIREEEEAAYAAHITKKAAGKVNLNSELHFCSSNSKTIEVAYIYSVFN